jgi:transketolase
MALSDTELVSFAQQLRRDSLLSTSEAGSGHPTTCLSAADIVAVLFGREMVFDPADGFRPGSDHFVLSKGHAAPVLWSALRRVGAIDNDLMTLRRADSPLEGHPTPRMVPGWVRVATGSLGQGLNAAIGMALARRVGGDPGRLYCLMGDGEIAEGSVWEAAEIGAHDKLANVCAIVDVNGLGQSGPTMHGHDVETIAAKWRAFGWHAIAINGHDVVAIAKAFAEARATTDRPSVIVARTEKGHGVDFLADKPGWHGKTLKKGAELDKALSQIGDPRIDKIDVVAGVRGTAERPSRPPGADAGKTPFTLGQEVATREAYGEALVRVGAVDPRIVVLDAETKNSTFAEKFKDKYPARFFECFIAEQNMVGAALGAAAEGYVPFCSTFAAFFARAYDFIRMGAYSSPPHLILCGSHVGVSIGEDGPSQMGLEDLAMMRAVIGSTVLYPSDATSCSRLVEEAIDRGGIVYLRTSRPKTKVLYGPDEKFPVGGCKVHGAQVGDVATIVAAGVTLHEALAAQKTLAAAGVKVRVVDLYSVKPLDVTTLARCAVETNAIITVEDHALWGGIGDAVAAAVRPQRMEMLAVTDLPRSAKPEECLAMHRLDVAAIEAAVRKIIA